MTIYEKNLGTLTRFYPKMDELIKKAKHESESEIEIIEEYSMDDEIILRIKNKYGKCYLNGKRNAREPAKEWYKTLGKLATNAPILIMGIGNSTYLRELVEQTETRLAIVVYEPSLEIFLHFLSHTDIEAWMEKHTIIFWVNGLSGMDVNSMKHIIGRVLTYEILEYARILVLHNYDILFPKETLVFMRICRQIASEGMIQYNTGNTFSSVMVKNVLFNARYLINGYKTTQLPKVLPKGIPGILVAAGPSLNKNISELKRAKGRAFIIAVDTAVKPLLKEGIVPDMFAIIDGRKPLDLVRANGAEKIPMLALLEGASEIFEYHKGMKFFYNEGIQFAEKILTHFEQEFGNVNTGGSVATSAFSLLYKIGVETVILVGQDLAYTNNCSHADGTFQEVMQKQDTSRFLMVEGNSGEKVPTTGDLRMFLNWYESYIESCQKMDTSFRVINATEGGAKIKGTEVMTLKEAIDSECIRVVDIQKSLQKLEPMFDEEGQEWVREYLSHIPDECLSLASSAYKTKKIYQKLDQICNKKNIDRKEYLSILKKLERQIKNIEQHDIYDLVVTTMNEAQYIMRGEQFLKEDTMQAEGKEIARKGILYMESVARCAKIFRDYAAEIFLDL